MSKLGIFKEKKVTGIALTIVGIVLAVFIVVEFIINRDHYVLQTSDDLKTLQVVISEAQRSEYAASSILEFNVRFSEYNFPEYKFNKVSFDVETDGNVEFLGGEVKGDKITDFKQKKNNLSFEFDDGYHILDPIPYEFQFKIGEFTENNYVVFSNIIFTNKDGVSYKVDDLEYKVYS